MKTIRFLLSAVIVVMLALLPSCSSNVDEPDTGTRTEEAELLENDDYNAYYNIPDMQTDVQILVDGKLMYDGFDYSKFSGYAIHSIPYIWHDIWRKPGDEVTITHAVVEIKGKNLRFGRRIFSAKFNDSSTDDFDLDVTSGDDGLILTFDAKNVDRPKSRQLVTWFEGNDETEKFLEIMFNNGLDGNWPCRIASSIYKNDELYFDPSNYLLAYLGPQRNHLGERDMYIGSEGANLKIDNKLTMKKQPMVLHTRIDAVDCTIKELSQQVKIAQIDDVCVTIELPASEQKAIYKIYWSQEVRQNDGSYEWVKLYPLMAYQNGAEYDEHFASGL